MDEKTRAYLSQVPSLERVPGRSLDRLAEELAGERVTAKDVLFAAGDAADRVFLLRGGRVKLHKMTEEGREFIIAYVGPRVFFGLEALLPGLERQAIATATDDTLLFSMAGADMQRLLAEDAALSTAFMEMVLLRLYATERRLEGLLFKDVTCKLAMLILELEARYGLPDEQGVRISRAFTHQEMANLIGATRETVSLTLSELRRRGLITFDKRMLIIVDMEGLGEMV